jgi:hypothetical protein
MWGKLQCLLRGHARSEWESRDIPKRACNEDERRCIPEWLVVLERGGYAWSRLCRRCGKPELELRPRGLAGSDSEA